MAKIRRKIYRLIFFVCRNCMQTFNRDIDPLGIQFFFCLIVLRISRMYILRMLLKDRRSIEGDQVKIREIYREKSY